MRDLTPQIRPDARTALLEAAFQLFNRKPDASLGEIATHAGVGRATLHRYFSSRDELLKAMALTAAQELDAAIEEATKDARSHTEGLRLMLEAMIPMAERQLFLANQHLDHIPEITASYQKDMDDLANEIESARSEGTFAADITTEWIVQTYENLTYAAWTMVHEGHATPRQAADYAWRTLTRGLGPKQHQE
ncbi:MAG: helix-turn-helix domain-containing protein [Pseudomonadota bacterium]